MREFIINENDSGQRLDRFVRKSVKSLPDSLMYRYIRQKKIKINSKRAEISTRLSSGDRVQMYINDEFFTGIEKDESFKRLDVRLDIVYEDENILLVNKPAGLICHSDDKESYNTLISHIKAYLYKKGEYDDEKEASFAPALCNRIDRNTQGIVIAAKNAASLKVINEKIKLHQIKKQYLCLVYKSLSPEKGEIRNYLRKDGDTNTVRAFDKKVEGSKLAVTYYETLAKKKDISLVKVSLLTGRTHQIRCQTAYLGHPLIGDGKYGKNEINARFGYKYQALCSYKITFDFSGEKTKLDYLSGKSFCLKQVDFVKDNFGNIDTDKI